MAALSWCFAFPYAPNEPIRAQAWEVVSAFYLKHFPTTPQLIHSATPVGERFLRAKTRNELVRMAGGYDVVVLVDADTLIHPDGIRTMVDAVAARDMFLGKPFLRGVNLPLESQRRLAAYPDGRWPRARFNDPGAAWVIRPDSWWAAGGMDEGFRSWGGEDEAFHHLFAAVGGTLEYDQRAAVKTEHVTPRWSSDPDWADTWERSAVARHVWLHPELAPEWLAVRHLPGIAANWVIEHGVNVRRRG
jgi:hypothetical protein